MGTDGALLRAVGVLVGVLVLIGIPVTSETLTRGRTLGKKLVGLRTVRDDAGPITFRHAMARGLVGVVEIYLCQGIPALICSLVTLRSKRLGDIAAGTYVIRERVAVRIPPPVAMPPELAAWAAGRGPRHRAGGLQAGVRTFLAGRAELTPGPAHRRCPPPQRDAPVCRPSASGRSPRRDDPRGLGRRATQPRPSAPGARGDPYPVAPLRQAPSTRDWTPADADAPRQQGRAQRCCGWAAAVADRSRARPTQREHLGEPGLEALGEHRDVLDP